MIIDLLGLIFATLIVIIQEFLKDRIKKNWIRTFLLMLIIISLVFSGYKIFESRNSETLKTNENLDQKNKIDSLNFHISQINNKSDSLISKIDSINNRLVPFLSLAQSKYPYKNINTALELLIKDLQSVKKNVEEAIISKIDSRIINKDNKVEVQLNFTLTNKNIRDKIVFDVALPVNSNVDILNIEVSGLNFNLSQSIAKNKKSASVSFTSANNDIPSLKIILSKYSIFKLRSNYLEKDIEIK